MCWSLARYQGIGAASLALSPTNAGPLDPRCQPDSCCASYAAAKAWDLSDFGRRGTRAFLASIDGIETQSSQSHEFVMLAAVFTSMVYLLNCKGRFGSFPMTKFTATPLPDSGHWKISDMSLRYVSRVKLCCRNASWLSARETTNASALAYMVSVERSEVQFLHHMQHLLTKSSHRRCW